MSTDRRRAILDAALALVATQGIAALSIRQLARQAGLTHQAPYHHFASREAILAALAQEGFALLRVELLAACEAAGPRPEDQFRACGVAYFRFAVAHPAHFQLMFRPEPDLPECAELRAVSLAAMQVLVDVVLAGQRAGVLPGSDAIALVITSWSTAHGAAALWVDGALPRAVPMLRRDPERVAEMIAQTLTNLLVGAAAVTAGAS